MCWGSKKRKKYNLLFYCYYVRLLTINATAMIAMTRTTIAMVKYSMGTPALKNTPAGVPEPTWMMVCPLEQ